MISVYGNKNECCGCTACKFICPVDAIEMIADKEGFLYPTIDQTICIECKKCQDICAFKNGYSTEDNFAEPLVFAARHKNENVLLSSTSGGAFTAISDYVLNKGGVVFGAGFDDNFNVIHQIAEDTEMRERLKGSKYVQSDLKKTYLEVKKSLAEDKLVLFTGTPCQNTGLRAFLLEESVENLILCDLVCHGTPSPLMWREYLENIVKKTKQSVEAFSFRDKRIGWRGANTTVKFAGKSVSNKEIVNVYSKLYFSQTMTRPSCHNCKYTNLKRPSDITIADFWGIEDCTPDFDDNKGTSLLVINTEKGKKVLNNIREDLIIRESCIEDCVKKQTQLQAPPMPAPYRQEFWHDYEKYGYGYISKKYGGNNIKAHLKRRVKSILATLGLLDVIRRIKANN
jgi:coenzyme F420-reducing hydrogenase beta subunit